MLRDLLTDKGLPELLEGFKRVFGGVVFILDNAGGVIGQGCQGAGGIVACVQCPNSELQITSPIIVDGMAPGSLMFCPTTREERSSPEVKKENLRLIAEILARLVKAEGGSYKPC